MRSTRRQTAVVAAIEPGREWQHVRAHAARRVEDAIDEIPGVLRHLKVFLLAASISMVVFGAGLLVVLWKAVG
ncbi:MAG: hypothetical protein ACM3OO_14450 [Planctomycetaceae bacterium]